jgi:hypothetical protein
MLNENAEFMSVAALDHQVSRLNTKGFQTIDTEWEVAVLNAFSKLGRVEHEPNLHGSTRADLLFTHTDGSRLLADVVTVSDEGRETKTGVRAFEIELKERLEKEGLLFRGWSLSVGTHPTTRFGELGEPALPHRSEFAKEIFNANFKTFLLLVKQHPHEQRTYYVSTTKTAVALTYLPSYKYFTMQLPTNNPAVSKDKNPVFNALKMKARQLKKTGHDGSKAIILCDGGSQMVHSKPHGPFEFNFNVADAAKDFLRQHKTIDLILVFASVSTSNSRYGLTKPPYRRIKATLIPGESFGRLPESIKQTLGAVEDYFPEPENTADGARQTIRNKFDRKEPRPLAGGWEMSSNRIKISATSVLALLAGNVTQDQLFNSLGFKPQSRKVGAIRNPFQFQLNQKTRVTKVEVEHVDEADETYLTFHFDGPDPALSDFINPKKAEL